MLVLVFAAVTTAAAAAAAATDDDNRPRGGDDRSPRGDRDRDRDRGRAGGGDDRGVRARALPQRLHQLFVPLPALLLPPPDEKDAAATQGRDRPDRDRRDRDRDRDRCGRCPPLSPRSGRGAPGHCFVLLPATAPRSRRHFRRRLRQPRSADSNLLCRACSTVAVALGSAAGTATATATVTGRGTGIGTATATGTGTANVTVAAVAERRTVPSVIARTEWRRPLWRLVFPTFFLVVVSKLSLWSVVHMLTCCCLCFPILFAEMSRTVIFPTSSCGRESGSSERTTK